MANLSVVSRHIPSNERISLITEVGVGDRLDIVSILGRPGRAAQFNTTSNTDVVEYKLNTLRHLTKKNKGLAPETIKIWSGGNEAYIYAVSGDTVHVTEDWIQVSSIEIIGLTLSEGTTIEIVVW